MSKEEAAETIRNKALSLVGTNAREAMDLLMSIMENYKNTLIVGLVVDDIIRIGRNNGFWDESIFACQEAQNIKSGYKKHYLIEEQAFQLEKTGNILEATELRYNRDIEPHPYFRGNLKDWLPSYGTLRYYGDAFAEIGEHDRAWRIYNQAIINAGKIGESPHTIRQSMAKLLLKENKPSRAVEMLITGICEAQRWAPNGAPKSLTSDLKRALKASGIKDKQAAEKIYLACKIQGKEASIDLFNKLK